MFCILYLFSWNNLLDYLALYNSKSFEKQFANIISHASLFPDQGTKLPIPLLKGDFFCTITIDRRKTKEIDDVNSTLCNSLACLFFLENLGDTKVKDNFFIYCMPKKCRNKKLKHLHIFTLKKKMLVTCLSTWKSWSGWPI